MSALVFGAPVIPIPCPLCGARESDLGTTHYHEYPRSWTCGYAWDGTSGRCARHPDLEIFIQSRFILQWVCWCGHPESDHRGFYIGNFKAWNGDFGHCCVHCANSEKPCSEWEVGFCEWREVGHQDDLTMLFYLWGKS